MHSSKPPAWWAMPYRDARAGLRHAPVAYTDDAGQATVYQIRDRHRNQEVRELVPGGYPGTLVTDRGPSYEAEELAGVDRQKCLSHLLRNVKEVVTTKSGRACEFGEGVLNALKQASQLWRDHRAGSLDGEAFRQRGREIEDQLTYRLRCRQLTDPDNQRLLDGIGLHNDRGQVLRFLHNPAIEPTNNRAERALRPAVIARKVSQCSKTQRGADAFAAFTTVIRTIAKKANTSIAQGLRSLPRPHRSTAPATFCSHCHANQLRSLHRGAFRVGLRRSTPASRRSASRA